MRNRENAMPVNTVDKFERHRGSAINGVHVTASGAKTTVASKRNELKIATMGTPIHCTTKGRISTVYHLIHVFNDRIARMSKIYKFFIMVFKDILENICHKIIMKEKKIKENPHPSRLRGRGVE